jgi:hypothetical protein
VEHTRPSHVSQITSWCLQQNRPLLDPSCPDEVSHSPHKPAFAKTRRRQTARERSIGRREAGGMVQQAGRRTGQGVMSEAASHILPSTAFQHRKSCSVISMVPFGARTFKDDRVSHRRRHFGNSRRYPRFPLPTSLRKDIHPGTST